MKLIPRQFLISLALVCVTSTIASTAAAQKLQNRNGKTVDFSGHWEMNYGDSDNIQLKVNSIVREMRRRAERQSSGNMNRSSSAGYSMGSSGYNGANAIIGLAQMADSITQTQLLEVEQGDSEVKVKRDDTFALSCEFYGDYFQTVETPFGNETCGWDSHQLLFRVFLPDGLSIQHRFTLGPSGQKLNVATTVVSDRVSSPFTLNRVYDRYQPGESGYSCELTLTRGRVCSTGASR